MICPNCRSEISVIAKICPFCRSKLNSSDNWTYAVIGWLFMIGLGIAGISIVLGFIGELIKH